MITRISVGDNVIVNYNTPKVCQVLKIKEYDNASLIDDTIQSITMEQAKSYRYQIDFLMLCSAATGKKLNRKCSYNARCCECLVEYIDGKRALITQLEKLIT